MILFLDFDGVLHPEMATSDRVLLARAPFLWEILRACPSVEVVVASSWRKTRTLDELRRLLTGGGGEDLADRIIDVTPEIPVEGSDRYRSREVECLAWIEANEHRYPISQRPLRWLALDDVHHWFSLPCWNLHLVDYRTGLTEQDVQAVIAKLSKLEAKR